MPVAAVFRLAQVARNPIQLGKNYVGAGGQRQAYAGGVYAANENADVRVFLEPAHGFVAGGHAVAPVQLNRWRFEFGK